MIGEAEMREVQEREAVLQHAQDIVREDVAGIRLADGDANYGGSWKRRGGVGAFMMLARKWDRIERAMERVAPRGHELPLWDIYSRAAADMRPEGLIDDIRDLRRYLMLVQSEVVRREVGTGPDHLVHLHGLGAVDLQAVADAAEGPDQDWAGPRVGRLLLDWWQDLEHSCLDNPVGRGEEEPRYRSVFDVDQLRVSSLRQALLGVEAIMRQRGIRHGAHRDNA